MKSREIVTVGKGPLSVRGPARKIVSINDKCSVIIAILAAMLGVWDKIENRAKVSSPRDGTSLSRSDRWRVSDDVTTRRKRSSLAIAENVTSLFFLRLRAIEVRDPAP